MANLELTLHLPCRVGCSYCPQEKLMKNYHGDKIMSLDTLEKCLDKIPKSVKIDFSGMSESLLYPYFNEAMNLVKNKGFQFCMYTTLFGLTEDKLQTIVKCKPNPLAIHVPDVNMKTQVNSKYKELLIKLVNSTQISSFIVFNQTQEKIRDLINGINTPIHSRAGNLEEFKCNYIEGDVTCSSIDKIFDHNVLLPNGDVLICCMDYSLEYKLGNLLENSYEEVVYNNQKYIENRMKDKDFICRKCAYGKRK